MAQLTVQRITQGLSAGTYSGLLQALVAANAGGDKFQNDGRTYLHVKNGGGSPITVTIDSRINCNQGHDHNPAVSVGAGEERLIGPFGPEFNSTDGLNNVDVTYSGVTSVTVNPFSLAEKGR